MTRPILIFGLIAGAILSAMMLITIPLHDRIGFDYGLVVGYTSMVVAFLMVYFGVKSYRDDVAGGQVSFGRAFAVGLLIALVASVCYVATWELIYQWLAPDYLDKYTAYVLEKARHSGATEAQIAEKAAEMARFNEWYKNPFANIAMTMLEPLPVGLLFALGSAVVLSRKRRAGGQAIA